jgi:hypothetical protein
LPRCDLDKVAFVQIEIELTKPQEAHCFLSEPVQDNLFQKGASQNGAVSACVMHDAVLGREPTR